MALATFTFSGAYEVNDQPAEGKIAVIPNRPVLDPDNDTVIVGKFLRGLGANGDFSLTLPSEDDLFYTLVADLVGAENYKVTFAASSEGAHLTVDQITPVSPSEIPSMDVAAILAYIDDQVVASGGVASVSGKTGVVTLNAADIAETSTLKVLTSTERTKLAGITSGATVNSTDAALRDRSTHTGTQLAVTVSDFIEAVEDAVAALIGRSTHTGITWTYSDAGTGVGTLAATVTGGGTAGVDAEGVRDVVGTALQGSGAITVTVSDPGDSITISTTATANSSDATLLARVNHTGTQFSSTISDFVEAVEDAVGAILTRSSHSGISFVYSDGGNTINATTANSQTYVWRYASGAWPTLPTTAPTGCLVVQAYGPTQPSSVPSWIGTTPDKVPAIYTYAPLT